MTIVSSFCGPSGIIWGYDMAKSNTLRQEHELGVKSITSEGKDIPVYSAKPLLEATNKLFGTVEEPHFPLLPGSHVPCAGKNIKNIGPKHLYAAFAFAIASDRSRTANLIMEDLGWIPLRGDVNSQNNYRKMILSNLTHSIIEVSKNQKVHYKEIFVDIIDVEVGNDEVGCALVALPYFSLAQKAIPNGKPEELLNTTLEKWEILSKNNFLTKK
jgi:histidine decarboxylase